MASCKNTGAAEKLYLSAVESYAEHDLNTAYIFVKQAQKVDNSFYQAEFLEAKILFLQEKFSESAKICKKLCRKFPEYTDARLFLIRCNIFLGKIEESENALEKETSFNSTDWRVFYLYSLLYGKQNKIDTQLIMLNRAELALFDTKKVYENLASLWDEMGVRDKVVNYKLKSRVLSDGGLANEDVKK
jgi:tetratricopeptide (TPR) repeat protein